MDRRDFTKSLLCMAGAIAIAPEILISEATLPPVSPICIIKYVRTEAVVFKCGNPMTECSHEELVKFLKNVEPIDWEYEYNRKLPWINDDE